MQGRCRPLVRNRRIPATNHGFGPKPMAGTASGPPDAALVWDIVRLCGAPATTVTRCGRPRPRPAPHETRRPERQTLPGPARPSTGYRKAPTRFEGPIQEACRPTAPLASRSRPITARRGSTRAAATPPPPRCRRMRRPKAICPKPDHRRDRAPGRLPRLTHRTSRITDDHGRWTAPAASRSRRRHEGIAVCRRPRPTRLRNDKRARW